MIRVCPFRKVTYFLDLDNNGNEFLSPQKDATYMREDFKECYYAECEMWDSYSARCGITMES